MRVTPPRNSHTDAPSLSGRAEADLAFVRGVLSRSQHFSAVPGVGGVLMGVTAVAAAGLASLQPTRERWLAVWLVAAVVGFVLGAITLVRKARASRQLLSALPARRFALGLAPPLVVGGMLTVAALQTNAWGLLAPIWLCCYGIGVLGAGAVSALRPVLALGSAFIVLGALAIATPEGWADLWMGLGFGMAHIIVGAIVVRRYGG